MPLQTFENAQWRKAKQMTMMRWVGSPLAGASSADHLSTGGADRRSGHLKPPGTVLQGISSCSTVVSSAAVGTHVSGSVAVLWRLMFPTLPTDSSQCVAETPNPANVESTLLKPDDMWWPPDIGHSKS